MIHKAFFKDILIVVALLAASGYTVMAQAHCLNNQTITNNSNNFQWDTYVTVCPAGATGLTARVSKQLTGTGTLSLEIGKGGFGHLTSNDAAVTVSSCDAVTGNITPVAATPGQLALNGGAGQYTIVVSKNSANIHTYDLEWHCTGVPGDIPEQQGGPLVGVGLGLTDSLDAVSGSALIANDTQEEINIPFNH